MYLLKINGSINNKHPKRSLLILFIKTTIFFYFLALSQLVICQVSDKGEPYNYNSQKNHTNIKFEKVKPQKNYIETQIQTENNFRFKKGQFGYQIKTELNSVKNGKWFTTSDDIKIWELGIKSSEAKSIQVIFSKFELPPSGKLFIYNYDKTEFIGAFTYKNNKESKKLATLPVSGDKIVIQYIHENRYEAEPYFEINEIVYGFKELNPKTAEGYNSSGACNVNINCSEGGNYQNEKRGVARIYFNGYFCTGALINNTNNDGTPYFLTANHCISNQSTAENTVFLFNYESPYCNNIEGSTANSISGSDLIATGYEKSLDFTLLKLSTAPPAEYAPYFLGWDITGKTNKTSVAIHHPSADIKKISTDKDTLYTSNYGSSFIPYTHWLVKSWETGTTEGGSSGSPLLNNKGQIIGDLTGGEARCSYNYNDLFQKFSVSWDYYTSPSNQLKHWLDPINKNIDNIEGFDPENYEEHDYIKSTPVIACPFDTIEYRIKLEASHINSYTVNWSLDNNATIVSQQSDSVVKVIYSIPGYYVAKATINNVLTIESNMNTLINPCIDCKSNKSIVCTNDTINLQADNQLLKDNVRLEWILKDATLVRGDINSKNVSVIYKTEGNKDPQMKIANSYYVSLNNNITIKESPPVPLVMVNYQKLYIEDVNDFDIQWYKNTAALVGEIYPSLNIVNNGEYHVKISASNGCSTTSDTLTIKLESERAISVIKDIKVYPTVVDNNTIYLDINLLTRVNEIQVRIISTDGKILISETLIPDSKSSTVSININKLGKGIYIIHLLNDTFSSQHKIIVR